MSSKSVGTSDEPVHAGPTKKSGARGKGSDQKAAGSSGGEAGESRGEREGVPSPMEDVAKDGAVEAEAFERPQERSDVEQGAQQQQRRRRQVPAEPGVPERPSSLDDEEEAGAEKGKEGQGGVRDGNGLGEVDDGASERGLKRGAPKSTAVLVSSPRAQR